MYTDFCETTVLRSERCDASEARDTVRVLLDRANSASLPELRQDIVNNVKRVHTALECLANGEAPPLSPAPSLPDSLDGWLPPGRQSSCVSVADSLECWLPESGASHREKGKHSMCQPGTPTSHPVDSPDVVQRDWSGLISAGYHQQGNAGPALLATVGEESQLSISTPVPDAEDSTRDVEKEETEVAEATEETEGDSNPIQQTGKLKQLKNKKTKKRKRTKEVSADEGKDAQEESSSQNKNYESCEQDLKSDNHQEVPVKKEKLSGKKQ